LFTFYKQLNAMDCGPTCLRMVAKHYGRHYNREGIAESTGISKQGVSLLGISEAAEKIGFESQGVQLTFRELKLHATLPCILHWDQNHFVVLVAVKNKSIKVADPAKGMVTYSTEEFLQRWITTSDNGEQLGIALLLNPTSAFFDKEGEKETKLDWKRIGSYFRKVRWKLVQVFIALLVTSLLQLMLPFLTQIMVDRGINTRNLQLVTVILVAQLVLVFSRTIADFIRSRLLLYISTVVNLSILSDFWVKLTKLPLSYFDNHHTGEILQRIGDNKQIENFLMGNALNTLFSLFNFVIYAVVLALYDASVFAVFIIGNVLYFSWIQFFLRIRRKINYQTFYISAKENNATLQLVQGMQELRLNNAEQLKRREWENIQTGIFQLNFRSLTYSQYQQSGSLLITHGKDLLITFLVAGLVIDGKLTFGAMLAIQYIIGQLNSPVEQFAGFVQTAQDAKISLERLNEIHHLKEEETQITQYIYQLPENRSISFHNLSFTYPGAGNEPVLKNIDVEIPEGKVTAIVGASGSGKTTLLKLLLKFYDFYEGEISIGNTGFKNMSPSYWRSQCGAVMQDGYIFNDTIARNIAPGDEEPDHTKLRQCCETAKILSFIESLPNSFNTQLGAEGVGMSQGQKQRLLIARAIYKDPQYLFFDEATNSLDSGNEKAIVENLEKFFTGRTVIIVAHRLSTVKNADKIIVLHNGEIAEEGTHTQLSAMKGKYYELVKNQLELGN
jgi:ATP-binding cassette subfamily B protein